MATILIVEDEALMRETLRRGLDLLGHHTVAVATGVEGLEELVAYQPDMVLLDLVLRDEFFNGLELLERIRKIYPELPVVVMSGYGTVDSAVDAMKIGAREFVQKPFDMGQISSVIDRVDEVSSLRKEVSALRSVQAWGVGIDDFVYASQVMQTIAARAEPLGRDRAACVLISGEFGSGKTALVDYIHRQVQPHSRPLISVDCCQVAEGLAIADVFGDGQSEKIGRCEMADGGSIVFEEIGCLDLEFQRALLDFADHRRIARRGVSRRVDVRIMATSTARLAPQADGGAMLPELLQRLGTNSFFIPPLRERSEDVEPLSRSFASNLFAHDSLGDIEELVRLLPGDCPWWGNVRELRNWVERMWLERRIARIKTDLPFGDIVDA